jgi:hypothetical protein
MEYFSSDESVVKVNKDGNYTLLKDGTANITVQIKGNTVTAVTIPVTVEDVTPIVYNIIVAPIIKSIREGITKIISAKVVDNFNNEITTPITLTPSGADSENNYKIVDNGNNSWSLTNELFSQELLTLTFTNEEYNLEYVMQVNLKAML